MNDLLKRLPRTIRSDQWLVYGCVALVIMSCMLYVSMNALLVDITGSRARFERESQVESATFLLRDPFADLSTFEQDHGFAIEPVGRSTPLQFKALLYACLSTQSA
ncbi:MAG: hypothetical protein NTV26_02175 [Caldiserica bacterium]|nr:hypothetical protein [Caldisericota bacterium]